MQQLQTIRGTGSLLFSPRVFVQDTDPVFSVFHPAERLNMIRLPFFRFTNLEMGAETPPKMPRPRILVFIKDEALARRLYDTAIRFAITEADIIENTVRKNLPEAPFQYKPKRRMRFST